jgi:hypothetical protein
VDKNVVSFFSRRSMHLSNVDLLPPSLRNNGLAHNMLPSGGVFRGGGGAIVRPLPRCGMTMNFLQSQLINVIGPMEVRPALSQILDTPLLPSAWYLHQKKRPSLVITFRDHRFVTNEIHFLPQTQLGFLSGFTGW